MHTHSGWIMANQNLRSKIRTLYILKMLYTGCSTKEAISLFLSRTTKISRINVFCTFLLYMLFRLWVNADDHKRWYCNNTAFFVEHLEFKKKWFLHIHIGWIVANNVKNLKSKHYHTFWKCSIQVAPWTM